MNMSPTEQREIADRKDFMRNEGRARREDKKLDKGLKEDPVIRNARDIMVFTAKNEADRVAVKKAFDDPKGATPDMRQRINDAMQSAQVQENQQVRARMAQAQDINNAIMQANMQRQAAAVDAAQRNMDTVKTSLTPQQQIDEIVRKVKDQEGQLSVLEGNVNPDDVQIAIYINRCNPKHVRLEARYIGEWAVSYSGLTLAASVGIIPTSVTVANGYFTFGKYRSIEATPYSPIAAPSTATDYVVVARFVSGAGTFPTVAAVTLANYNTDGSHYTNGFTTGQKIIARGTVAVSDGIYYWTNMVQCQFGEISLEPFVAPGTLYNVLTVASDGSGGLYWTSDWVRAHT